MHYLIEDPTLWLVLGVVAEGALVIAFLQTGRGWVLAAMGLVLAAVLAGLFVERVVETDVEQVESTLDGMRQALEKGDVPTLLASIGPQAGAVRGRAEQTLRQYQVEEAKIRNLVINVSPLTQPPSATVRFNGIVRLQDRTGQVPYEQGARRIEARFERSGDRWLLVDFTDSPIDLRE